jgi:TorA maturation chaperone TorD
MTGTSTFEEDLRHRGRAYSFLSTVFLAEPPEDLAQLSSEAVVDLLYHAFDGEAVAAWRECVAGCDSDSLRKEFHALFTAPMERYVFPYESCYRVPEPPGPLMGPPAIAVQEAYARAGLGIAPEAGEAPDHVGLELMFAGFLLEQAAAALPEKRNELLLLHESFRTEHLNTWVPALAEKIERSGRSCFYKLAGRLTVRLVAEGLKAAG